MVRTGPGRENYPGSVLALGGQFGYENDGQTPNTEVTQYECRTGKLVRIVLFADKLIDDQKANATMRREYRAPFVVPEMD